MKTDNDQNEYIAFDHGGTAYPVGNCGDFESAEELANDASCDDWMFLLTVADLKQIIKNYEKYEDEVLNPDYN